MTRNAQYCAIQCCAIACVFASAACAKPVHLEQVKSALIRDVIRCANCHASESDATLTAYGRRIADLGSGDSILDRVREHEAEISQTASDAKRELEAPRVDVDGDGIANWVEILAGSDPSVRDARTDRHERIERVISCKLCHTSVSRFPIPGKERAPHNAFGDALENLAARSRRGNRRPPPDVDAPIEPIAPRLDKMRKKDTDRDRTKNWDEIRTFHHPADSADTPSPEETKAARQHDRERRKHRPRFGDVHPQPRRQGNN